MISIVVTTYNRKKYLPNTIKSILNQTYQDFEIIIINDGSTDDTDNLFKNVFLDKRVRYIKLDQNKGATFCRNKGVEVSVGDFILVWDSDDILYQHALELLLKKFSEQPQAVVISAPGRVVVDGNEVDYPKINEGFLDRELIIARELPPSNEKIRLVRARIFKKIRYVSQNIDFLVNVAIAEEGDWYHLNEPLGDIVQYNDVVSLTRKRKKSSKRLSIQRAPYLASYLEKHHDILKRRSPKKFEAFSYAASLGLLLSGDDNKARSILKWTLSNKKNLILYFFSYLPLSKFILSFGYYIKRKLL